MITLPISNELAAELTERFADNKETPVELGSLVNTALALAHKKALEPASVPATYRSHAQNRPFYIPTLTENRLKKLLKKRKAIDASSSLSSITMGLIVAAIQHVDSSSEAREPTQHAARLSALNLTLRDEQQRLIEGCEKGLASDSDAIVFAEASVGVGKTLAKALIAIERALKNKGHSTDGVIVITAPTYQIVKQIHADIQALASKNNLPVTCEMVRSRAEFISDVYLNEYLINDQDLKSTTVKAINELRDKAIFYREEYEACGLECKHLALSRHTSPDDPGELAYQKSRADHKSSDIIICTHAYLACHVSTLRRAAARKHDDNVQFTDTYQFNHACATIVRENDELFTTSLLPKINLLVVDEAHTLLESYQSIRSRKISLNVLKKTLKAAFSGKLAASTTAFIDEFSETATKSSDRYGNYASKITDDLWNGLEPIYNKLKNKRKTVAVRVALELIDEIYEMTRSNTKKHNVYKTPIKGHCNIALEPSPPNDWLHMTWLLTQQAICVSGTLALGNNINKYLPIAGKLNVDFSRIYTIDPIETAWLRTNVTLYTPESDTQNTAMITPKHNDDKAIKAWIQSQSQYIASQIERSQQGGAIVACTSYGQLRALYEALAPILAKNTSIALMVSKENQSLVSLVKHYKTLYKEGKRPVWLATMGVSTGVDITDSEATPGADHMLNQLFVTRLPISANNKERHIDKINNALITFRQLLGRLVRRPGRTGMEIHIMDSRAVEKRGIYKRFLVFLNDYSHATNKH